MADQEVQVQNEGPVPEVPKRDQTPKEPPVTFREFDVSKFLGYLG